MISDSDKPGERALQPGLLSRNLAAIQRRHPALHRLLASFAGATSTARPALTAGGEATIVQAAAGCEPVVLSPGGQPSAAAAAIIDALADDLKRGRCLALCGVGDGYVLTRLAAEPAQLVLGQQQCVHIIEPHPDVLLATLMIHDWTGSTGPIEDPRFQWWVGRDWASALHAALEADAYLPLPERPVQQGVAAEESVAALRQIIEMIQHGEQRLADRAMRLYARVVCGQIASMFGDSPPRQPRVLLLTTRFSTVLQHSTRDLAAAFEQLGWATRIPIEPTAYHRNSRRNLLRHLADFQPDLVVQIDHLRHEHRGAFPPQLPFVCWIQDDLPNLMKRDAGAAIGPRDFVLTTTAAVYEHDYGYPARQCIYMPKATRLPDLDAIPTRQADDVVYVSNASATAGALADELVAECGSQPELARLVRACCEAIAACYARGQSLCTVGEVDAIVRGCAAEMALDLAGGVGPARLAMRLFASVNNALYRQQAMGWAAAACARLGLSLGLYGAGWENHPTLGPFARGPVQYGSDLQSLTRSAMINLQVVPYMFLHQRWLDGIAAGGFFLVRAHPMDTLAPKIATFIEEHLDESIETAAQAEAALRGEAQQQWRELLDRRRRYDDHRGTDPVALYRAHRREGRDYIYESPADLDQVRFADGGQLDAFLERFAGDESARRAIAQRQRRYVEQHLTYSAGLSRVLRRIHALLQEEAGREIPRAKRETAPCA
ncbi:MAG: hypothetical protein IT430_08835 [Phycisphaerales bacterium]|nr:hypothetical protein [Phycisphaerales bacterium]